MADGSTPTPVGRIEIDLQEALLGLESCIGEDYGNVTLGLMQRIREVLLAQEPRDPGTGKTADELLCTSPSSMAYELRRWGSRMTEATCALITTRHKLVDEDDDCFHILALIEDSLIETAGQMAKAARTIDPQHEEEEAP